MRFSKQAKGTDGSAQTFVGDRGDHRRGRANSRRHYGGQSTTMPGLHERDMRTEMNANGGGRNWAQRRAELN
jgi:hypothetical protein